MFYYTFTTFDCNFIPRNAEICKVSSKTKNVGKAHKYRLNRHLPTYEKIIKNLYSFYHTNGESYISRDSLTDWNEKLKEFGFCPISRNSIINLKYYKKTYQKQAILSTEIRLPISRRYLQTLDETFRCYMIKRV